MLEQVTSVAVRVVFAKSSVGKVRVSLLGMLLRMGRSGEREVEAGGGKACALREGRSHSTY